MSNRTYDAKWFSGDVVAPVFERIVLDRFRIAFRQAISMQQFQGETDIKLVMDHCMRQLIVEVQAFIAAKEHKSLVKSSSIQLPADWWQYFRERWFPRWWLRKHPVKMMTIEQVHTDQIINVCPHLPISTNGGRQQLHLEWLKGDDRQHEQEDHVDLFRLRRFVQALAEEGYQKYSTLQMDQGPLYYDCSPRVHKAAREVLGIKEPEGK